MTEAKRNGASVPMIKCGMCGSSPKEHQEISPDPNLWGVRLLVVADGGWVSANDFYVCWECLGVMKELVRTTRLGMMMETGEVRVNDPLNV